MRDTIQYLQRAKMFEKHCSCAIRAWSFAVVFRSAWNQASRRRDTRNQEGSLHFRYGDSPCVAKLYECVCIWDASVKE